MAGILAKLLADARYAKAAGWLARWLDLKVVQVAVPQRIGHLALEGDSFLKDYRLRCGRFPVAIMIEPDHGGFANPVLAQYLDRYIHVIPRTAEAIALEARLRTEGFVEETAPYAVAMYETARCFDVYRRWGARGPLFCLTAAHRKATAAALAQMGVPDGAWFVCLHARGGGYSPSDEHWHLHRNVDIADYDEAIGLITKRGGWCIRMGDPTMPPMVPRPNVVDYALCPLKSPLLDIGLSASCRFFLGCASGLYNVAAMFGRPSILVNTTPLSGSYALNAGDLALPQAVQTREGRTLSFGEVFASKVADFRLAEEFVAAGLVARNVTPAEIREVTEEMLDRLDGTASYTDDDASRQALFRNYLRPGHYSFGGDSRIGRDFLRRNLPL
ncbi:TIGR04372 family glycosyltransferase [Methylobacterium sp. 1973]|uniref:TIGR04372 family glycosyltransferase n=1 Tax=Methylobacterium sp. 1973 TaxID=3156421 RepID=UPI003390A253